MNLLGHPYTPSLIHGAWDVTGPCAACGQLKHAHMLPAMSPEEVNKVIDFLDELRGE